MGSLGWVQGLVFGHRTFSLTTVLLQRGAKNQPGFIFALQLPCFSPRGLHYSLSIPLGQSLFVLVTPGSSIIYSVLEDP